uniref:Uncharacterized protein n=1 Tax=Macaca fascicularis TaxID=9541 RepID=A0A7N9DAA7_MACFA
CWKLSMGLLPPSNHLQCDKLRIVEKTCSWIHVQNVQVCYIGTHVPRWFAAPIKPSPTINSRYSSI